MNIKTEIMNIRLEECPARLVEATRKEIASGAALLAVKQKESSFKTGYSYKSYQVYLEYGNMYTELHYDEDTETLEVNRMIAGALFEIIKCGGPLIEMVARDALAAREKENPPAAERQAGTHEKQL